MCHSLPPDRTDAEIVGWADLEVVAITVAGDIRAAGGRVWMAAIHRRAGGSLSPGWARAGAAAP
jgi:hypothetical protein